MMEEAMSLRPPRDGKLVPAFSLDEAAALVPNDAVITASSSSGLGCPVAALTAFGELR
jgi:hypothetical protein